MKVAVVGATGLVGTKMLQVLAERNFPVTELFPVASERSIGKEVEFKGKKYKVVDYVHGKSLGSVAGPAGQLRVQFKKSLLLEATPAN